jgi:hypothetical protein
MICMLIVTKNTVTKDYHAWRRHVTRFIACIRVVIRVRSIVSIIETLHMMFIRTISYVHRPHIA